jgi:hypothetical protein
MENVQHARGDVEDAMRRLLQAVAETRKRNALALQQTACDADLLRAVPAGDSQTPRVPAQRVRP